MFLLYNIDYIIKSWSDTILMDCILICLKESLPLELTLINQLGYIK